MGSFDVACGISNLPIGYDDLAGFVILDHAESFSRYRQNRGAPGVTMYTYSNDLYRPVLPPVYGIYDSYGRLEDITPSTTTKLLEDEFGIPVKDVLDCIMCDRDIYDSMGEIFKRYVTVGKTDRDTNLVDALTAYGFRYVPELGFKFADFWLKPDEEDKALKIIAEDGTQFGHKVYKSDADEIVGLFAQHTGVYPGVEKDNWDRVKRLHDLSGMFFLKPVFESMVTVLDKQFLHSNDQARFDEDFTEWLAKFDEPLDPDNKYAYIFADSPQGWYTGFNEFVRRAMAVPSNAETYKRFKVYAGHVEELRQVHDLTAVMTATNRMIMPTVYATEGGERNHEKLNAIVRKILKQRRADSQ